MQRIINADDSDIYDFLAYVAYALPTLTRNERAYHAQNSEFSTEFHMLNWRECKGVEPSAHAEGRTPAELKSVRPTGTHPLPYHFVNQARVQRVQGF